MSLSPKVSPPEFLIPPFCFAVILKEKTPERFFHSASITPAISLSLPAKKYLAIFYYRDSTLVLLAVSKLVTQGKYGTDYKTTLF